jgi:hypothetical protein
MAPHAVVKREQEEEGAATQGGSQGEASQGGSEGGRPAASVGLEAMDEPQINVIIGVSLLHCQACFLPLKPPTFKVRIFSTPLAMVRKVTDAKGLRLKGFPWKRGTKSSIFWGFLLVKIGSWYYLWAMGCVSSCGVFDCL